MTGIPDRQGTGPCRSYSYVINGQVTFGGVGLPDVSVTATLTQTASAAAAQSPDAAAASSTLTNATGHYTLTVQPAGSYVLTFAKSSYRFKPVLANVPPDASQPVTAPDPASLPDGVRANNYLPLLLRR